MRGCFCERGALDCGAALIECAISIPVLFLLLFAIIDFGKLTRESNVVVQSTHRGARSGAALASAQKTYWCSQEVPKSFSSNCSDVLQWPIDYDALGAPQLRALEGGLRLTCSYLRHAGFDPREWKVSASGPIISSEGDAAASVVQRGMKVSVSQAQSRSRCITCFLGLFSGFFMAEESYFSFQFTC